MHLFLRFDWSRVSALGCVACLIWCGQRLGAAEPVGLSLPTVGSIERLDARLDALVPADAKIEVLAMGFAWSEGPVWVASDRGGLPAGSLLFSDIPHNRVHRWKPGDEVSVFLEPAGFTGPAAYGKERGSNGLTLDHQGRLLSCEHGDRRVSVLEKDGGKRTLADAWEGKRFNSPNDLAVHSSGAIYFTDPPYGLPQGFDDPRREIDFCGVYRIGTDGKVTLLCNTMTRPNGIAFSPDETKLYVAQSDPQAPIWKVFDVAADGTLDEGRTFFDATALAKARRGNPDGLKVDEHGNLFATGPGGVLVIAPDGTHLGTLLTGQATANCCFGEDGRTLFITADSLLCRVRLTTTGRTQVSRIRGRQADSIVAATPLSNGEWESLRGLAGLKELVLQAGRADDTRAEILASLPDIERLVLRESSLSDEGFRRLAACTTLRDLNVPQAACTTAGVKALADLPHLRSLRLGGANLGGKDVCEAIVRLPHLRTLHLIDTPIGDEGLAVLASRPDLWNLYLDGAGASDAAWQRYFAACPKVHVHVDQTHHDRDPGRTHE